MITSVSESNTTHLDDTLAGGQRQPHQTGAIDGHDLIPDVQSAGPLSRPSMHHVGDDDSRQDGAPPTLHDDQTQNLSLRFLYQHLSRSAEDTVYCSHLTSLHHINNSCLLN